MKIEISDSDLCGVAQAFAENIHASVVTMHLRRSWGIWEPIAKPNIFCDSTIDKDRIQRIRVALASINDQWDRRQLVFMIKTLFQKLRQEKGTHAKWQDYIARVRVAKAEHAANQPKQPVTT